MKKAAIAFCWLLQIGLAGVFLFAGARKLMADPMMVSTFTKIGMGQGFRLLTGVLEAGGGVALLVPQLAGSAAALLAVVMVGATIAHLTVLGGTPAPALGLLVACLIVVWLRRDTLPIFGD